MAQLTKEMALEMIAGCIANREVWLKDIAEGKLFDWRVMDRILETADSARIMGLADYVPALQEELDAISKVTGKDWRRYVGRKEL